MLGVEAPKLRAFPAKGYSYPPLFCLYFFASSIADWIERGLKVDTMVLEVLSVITAERAVSCFKQPLG